MKSPPRTGVILALTIVIAASAVAWRALQLSQARAACDSAQARLVLLRNDANEVLTLRTRSDAVSLGAQEPGNVHALLRNALRRSGVSDNAIREVIPRGSTPLEAESSGSQSAVYRKQAIAVTLAPLPLDKLGQLLSLLAREHPEWNVRGIDLRTETRRGASATSSVTLQLESIYAPTQESIQPQPEARNP